jgi:NADH-quinone oxidoreductase subunit I
MSVMKRYFKEILDVIQSTRKGMSLTWKHAWDARKQRTQHNIQDEAYFSQSVGITTLQYPHVDIPIPDNGRYQLHNEMDDCIVCDKCVKVCPVDCIEIDPIKATGLVGHASDGSPIRLYAAKFDIDMSKCCFCGLCTTVCPTECLTMTSEYDFSVFEVKEHNFSFANLTEEEAAEKKKLYEQFVAEKEELKKSVDSGQSSVVSGQSPVTSPESEVRSPEAEGTVSKPAFKPSFKAKAVGSSQSPVASQESDVKSPEAEGPVSDVQRPVSKPAFKPSFKAKAVGSGQSSVVSGQSPVASQESEVNSPEAEGPTSDVQRPVSKPAFKPSFKAKAVDSGQSPVASQESAVTSPESEGPTSSPSPTSDVQRPTSNNDNPDPE